MQTTEHSQKQEKISRVIRVTEPVRKQINSILKKVNYKGLGRKVFPSNLIETLLKFVDDKVIKDLQEKSLRNNEVVDRQYQQYVRQHGETSREDFDDFCMKLFSNWMKERDAVIEGEFSY